MSDTNYTLEIDVPHVEGAKASIDLSLIPAETRLLMLKQRAADILHNRVNVTFQRYKTANAPYAAWDAYDAAQAADALQTTVAKPDGERPDNAKRPASVDLAAKMQEGIDALLKGELRVKAEGGTAKARVAKDPVQATITTIVERKVFEAMKAADAKSTFAAARKLVGGDGLGYLNAQIDAKVGAAAEADQAELRKQLESRRDEQFVKPAQAMAGVTSSKKVGELPSLL